MKQLILASQSPRRFEILKKAGYQFIPLPVYVSEIPNKNLSIDEQILDIAKRKAEAAVLKIQDQRPSEIDPVILAADTMVCAGNKMLGKPENEEEAFEYLRLLSGSSHYVKTGIILIDVVTHEKVSHLETSEVIFKKLSDDEIKNYIATKEPFDKAGGYGIQGHGSKLVEKFIGDFDNIVGLPLHALENLFKLKKWQMHRVQPDL